MGPNTFYSIHITCIYHLSIAQAMQDSAIASRAGMRLEAELEEQNQKIKDLKLQKEQARTKLST